MIFKNVVAILDNDFGSLRITKDNDTSYINDIDLTDSSKNLLTVLEKSSFKLFVLIREKLDETAYEQVRLFLPPFSTVIPFRQSLKNILLNIKKDYRLKTEETIFVSSDRSSRHIASANGYYSLPHIKLANMVIENKVFEFVRMVGSRSVINQLDDVLPYYLKEMDNGICEFLSAVSNNTIIKAIQLKLKVQVLPVNLSDEDIVLINLDKDIHNQLLNQTIDQYRLLYSDDEKLIVTVGRRKIANIPIHGSHGHFVQLIPNDVLLSKSDSSQHELGSKLLISKTSLNILDKWPSKNLEKPASENFSTSSDIKLDLVDPDSILNNIKRYSGAADLDSRGKIESRHCLHIDNRRAVESIAHDLEQMGYYTRTWEFQTTDLPPDEPPPQGVIGATFYNVIAELPGIGDDFLIENNLSAMVRNIFIKHPNPSDRSWVSEIKELTGEAWFAENNLGSLPPLELKRTLEKIFGLEPWTQWWLKDKTKVGLGSEIILVGCHIDSTAKRYDNPDFDPPTSIAPGADDDGSGLSATLEIARVFSKLNGKLKHTIQFCFFNAEEVGRRGSMEYAKYMRRMNAPIRAVICMDMIGYNKDISNRSFEIHAGFNKESIRNICLPIAKIVEECAKSIGKLGEAQIYKGLKPMPGIEDDPTEEANRDKYDPAIKRSDHWSFQQMQYPAIVVSEDFFVNDTTLGEPKTDGNPNYHHFRDTYSEIDPVFASDIANSVALSVKKLVGF